MPSEWCYLHIWGCECSLGISNFLEVISSLYHFIVFLYFFALSLKKAFLLLLAILWNSVFRWVYLSLSPLPFAPLLYSAVCKASSDNNFDFLHFFFFGMILLIAYYTKLRTPFYCSSGTLSTRSLESFFHLDCIIVRDLIQVIPEWSSGFPYFLQFKAEFYSREFMIWATISSRSSVCWLYRVSPPSAIKNIISFILILTIWWCPCVESSLVLLEEVVCYDHCVLLAELVSKTQGKG